MKRLHADLNYIIIQTESKLRTWLEARIGLVDHVYDQEAGPRMWCGLWFEFHKSLTQKTQKTCYPTFHKIILLESH